MKLQKTIKNECKIAGRGLFSGEDVEGFVSSRGGGHRYNFRADGFAGTCAYQGD